MSLLPMALDWGMSWSLVRERTLPSLCPKPMEMKNLKAGTCIKTNHFLESHSLYGNPPQSTGTKKKANPFPDIEGEESAADFVSKYKRACIGRKTFFKDIQDKVAAEAPSTGQTPSIQV